MPQPAKSTASKGLLEAYTTARTARAMSDLFEEHARLTAKYVHACSRGHEVIQIAAGRLLEPQDYVSCYYRDDSLLLSMGLTPKELMLQLFAKKDDPFSGGRTYYSHPSLNPSWPAQNPAPKLRHRHASHPCGGLRHGLAVPVPSGAGIPSGARRQRSRRRQFGQRHFILQHWGRRHDRGRSGRSVPHDCVAPAADGLACARQRMGHQCPQLRGAIWRRHHLCQSVPRHRSAVGRRHRLGGL